MPYNSSTGIINAPLNINTSGDIQQAVNIIVPADAQLRIIEDVAQLEDHALFRQGRSGQAAGQ